MTVRGLSELCDLFAPIVTRLVTERPDALGLGDAPLCEVLALREFNGPYSSVLEVELHTEQSKWHGFVKSAEGAQKLIDTDSDFQGPSQGEFDLLSKLWTAFGDSPEFGSPRPVAFYPDLSAIITEDVGGQSFAMELRTHANLFAGRTAREHLAAACRKAGQWLLKFQAITESPSEDLLNLDELRDYIDLRLTHLIQIRHPGVDAEWRRGVLKFLDRVAPDITQQDRVLAGVHGDFSLGNVLVSDERLAVIDFERHSQGSVIYDLTHLHHHLYHLRSNPRYRGRLAQTLCQALLQGYDPHFDIRAPLFRLYQVNHALCMMIEASQSKPRSMIDSLHLKYLGRQFLRYIDQCCRSSTGSY